MRAVLLLAVVAGLAFGAGPGGYWGGGPGGLPSGFTLAGTIQALNLIATNNVNTNDLIAAGSLTANSAAITLGLTAGAGVSARAGSVLLDRLITRNAYVYNCYSPFGMAVYGATFTVLGSPSAAATAVTYMLSDTYTGAYWLNQNPDFAAAAGWVLTGTSITGGKLNKLTVAGVGTATSTALSNYPVVAGATYVVRIDVDSLSTGHDIVVTMGGTTFATLTAEGANQWARGTAVNATDVFTIAWGDGETGIVDNVYVYRLAPKLQVGGSLWNVAEVSTAATYTVLDGQHVLSIGHADSCVVTLPALSACFDVLTKCGREIIIENAGPGFCVITTPAGDAALNAIAGADSLHLAQYAVATLRAVSASHWAVAE